MVVLEQETQDGEKMKKELNAEAQGAQSYGRKEKKRHGAKRELGLTTPDLVLLSLLAERPEIGRASCRERV